MELKKMRYISRIDALTKRDPVTNYHIIQKLKRRLRKLEG